MQEFFATNQAAIIFYTLLILLIVFVRKHIDWQAFGIGLYRTKFGLSLMQRWGKKFSGLVQLLGYIGVGIGFIGMVFILFNLLDGFWNLLVNPDAPPVVSPVIPGFKVPGFDLKVPLITGWLALFVVIVIHEFSHGVVGRAHKIKIKSSGLLVFGPIAGAFVEPDEKQLVKQDDIVKYSVFAAGPWSNILSAFFFALLLGFLVTPGIASMTVPGGVEVVSVVPDFPAANASMTAGLIITSVNDVPVTTYDELSSELDAVHVGELVRVGTDDGNFAFTTVQNPEGDSTKGYLGVNLQENRHAKITEPWYEALLGILMWLGDLLYWVILLSLGIGLANLLPIGPLDGGRMLQGAARQITGNTKKGDWWWKKISVFTLALLVILLLIPLLKGLF